MKNAVFLLVMSLPGVAFHATERSRSPVVLSEFVADTMPTVQCHASTIVAFGGKLIVAWFGGKWEGSSDVSIWLSKRDSSGWGAPVKVADGSTDRQQFPCWNPVLFKPRHGPLMLFYKVGPEPQAWWGLFKASNDGGVTWSDPRRLPEGVIGPAKNKPVEFENGDILCPSSTEQNGWRVWFNRTSDGGATWRTIGPFNDPATIQAIQPSILMMSPQRLLAVGRTKEERMFSMESSDGGTTWSRMQLLNFQCANSGIDGEVLKDGRMLVVYNCGQNIPGKWDAGRDTLNVATSRDGRTWERACSLEHEPGGEFSYPAVIQTNDGLVHITYTWKRRKIRHVVLDPRFIE